MIYPAYNRAILAAKSDTIDLIQVGAPKPLTDAVYVGGAGIVVAVMEDGTKPQFTCVAGQLLPIAVKRIDSTSTTATLTYALYKV